MKNQVIVDEMNKKGRFTKYIKIILIFFALILCSIIYSNNSYSATKTAMLYGDSSNGYTLVFQSSSTQNTSTYGTYVASYTGFENNRYTNTNTPWTNYSSLIKKIIFETDISPISTAYWFCGFKELINIEEIEKLNTSNVTDMGHMFFGCSSLTSLDVSNFDTSNVTNMEWMFYGCRLTSLDVTKFDTSNVTDMDAMFYGCSSLTSLDVSNFDTSNVTNMVRMFVDCSSLTSLDVTTFDTSNVTDMGAMFDGCSSLTSLDVSNFDTSNVTSINSMFMNCKNLITLDLSNFDTSNVTNMYATFAGCTSLIKLDLSNFNTSNVTTMGYMFECTSQHARRSHFFEIYYFWKKF